ncbi:MAG: cation:proton antiporter [Acidimicrobiia bacterium]|nr:cation:proton antiporter [Acidimicrobiia bacterium]
MIVAAGGDALLLAELGAVILACGLLARLAGHLSLSPIPFYLLVGLLINQSGPLHVDAGRDFIEPAAAIGVVLLLFTLGLEYTPTELTVGLRTNGLGGLFDLVANATPGYLFGVLLGLDAPQSLALAGVTYISSSGIIAKLLGDLGRTGNRETPVVLSILVIEDLVMAFYLPLLAGLLAGGSAGSIVASVSLAVAAVVVVLLGTVRVGPTLSRLVFTRSPEVLLLTVLGLTLLVAGAAEALQVSAAVGAFLVGIALSGEAAERAEPLLMPLRDVFAAAFFLLFALEIDLGAIPDAIGPALSLAVLTAVTKVATGWWSARRAGIATRGRWRAGTTLIARGEFSIVIAGLAVLADPDSEIGAIAASYVLVLALVGPLATRFSDELVARFSRRRQVAVA